VTDQGRRFETLSVDQDESWFLDDIRMMAGHGIVFSQP